MTQQTGCRLKSNETKSSFQWMGLIPNSEVKRGLAPEGWGSCKKREQADLIFKKGLSS